MIWFLLASLLVQQENVESAPNGIAPNRAASSAATSAQQTNADEDAWVQEARDWLVACRVAYDKLNSTQSKELTERFQKLSPAALRVLVTVYEQTYRVESPLSAADRRPPDATEAEREWIMAYRILYDRLSVEESKKYAATLESMSPGQIRALVQVYQEKNRQQAERAAQQGGTSSSPTTPQPDNQEQNRRSLAEAQQRMEFEQQRRQMALGRAGNARKQTDRALVSANTTTAVTAAAENRTLREQDQFSKIQTLQHNAFQNRMYERSTPANPNGYGGFRVFPIY